MSTIEITLPDELKALADEKVASGQFRSHSDYFRALVEEDRRRQEDQTVERVLLERTDDAPLVEMNSADIAGMRAEYLRRRAARQG